MIRLVVTGPRCLPAMLLVAVLATAVGAVAVRGQGTRELTVDESIRLGLEHNARVRAAVAEAEAARSAALGVRAARLPAVQSQASYQRLSGNIPAVEFTLPGTDSTFTFQAVQLDRYHAELSVTQPLLGQWRLGQEARAAAHEAEAAELRAEQARADVAFEIRRGYWHLHQALATRATMAASMAQVEEHLVQVQRRLDVGAALRRDLLAAQTRRSEVMLERVEAENAVRVGQLELNQLLGLPLDTESLSTSVPDQVALQVPPPAEVVPVEDRPEVGALGEQVRGLEAQLRAARATRLPELDFTGRYVYSRPNPYFFMDQESFRGTWELGFSARWDIWSGGRTSARTGEARARLEAATARLADTRERAAVDVARQQLEVRRASEAITVAAQNVLEAEETFSVVRQQFQEGAALSEDVLDAEQAYRRALARRARAEADQAIAQAAVLHALGRVW